MESVYFCWSFGMSLNFFFIPRASLSFIHLYPVIEMLECVVMCRVCVIPTVRATATPPPPGVQRVLHGPIRGVDPKMMDWDLRKISQVLKIHEVQNHTQRSQDPPGGCAR